MQKNFNFKKIIFIIDNLEFGGGERCFVQLISRLHNQFEIFAAGTPGEEFEKEVKKSGAYFFPVDMRKQKSLNSIIKIRKIILKHKIDIIHSQGVRADFFARAAGFSAGTKNIICTTAMPVEGFDVSFLRKKIYRFFDWISEGSVKRFIVVSQSLKKLLTEKRRIPEYKVIKIYNGIELEHYIPKKNNQSIETSYNPPIIGAVGRMVWQKGFEYLIKAIPEIVKHIPEAEFLFIGDGPLLPSLKKLSIQLNLSDKIIFTGFLNDIKEVLSKIDILVVPSLLEGFPMITLEAMAMAKPVVASDIDGINEQITNGKNGILVSPKNPGAIADAVIALIRNKETAKQIGIAARKKVEQDFSVEKMILETEKVYFSMLKNELS